MSKNNTPNVELDKGKLAEMFLTKYCKKTFLKLWAYPNPYKSQGDELCDVLAVFEEHIFIFSIKNISFSAKKTTDVAWKRWKKKAIDKSISQVKTAERWIRRHPEKIFLDAKCTQKFPIPIDTKNWKFHRIVVAFGAEEACKNDSPDNISGSLAIIYADLKNPDKDSETAGLFNVVLPRDKVIHVFDSHNLEIILGELDTVRDLLWYFKAKENAVKKYNFFQYCGEEDVLAHYFLNFDKKLKRRYIGTEQEKISTLMIGEGEWQDFIKSDSYKRKKQVDKISYFWDDLLQRTFQNAFDGTLISDGDFFKGETALIEMAKEPRFLRRELSKVMLEVATNFPDDTNQPKRHVGCYPSFYSDRKYVFLILSQPPNMDYATEYIPKRAELLGIACGVVKSKEPHLKKIIGIAIQPPKIDQGVSEQFLLLKDEYWTKEDEERCLKANKGYGFFETDKLEEIKRKVYEFPPKYK